MSHIHVLVEDFIKKGKVFTVAQAEVAGISHQLLEYHCRMGRLVRLARGVYSPILGQTAVSDQLEVLQKKNMSFVLCLQSALYFHGFQTAAPESPWIAVKQGARVPAVSFALNCVRLSENAYVCGVCEYTVNDMPLQVYSPAKTVVDCFKFRNKIGLDTAARALSDGWRRKMFTQDELMSIASECRMAKVMAPYVEMVHLSRQQG